MLTNVSLSILLLGPLFIVALRIGKGLLSVPAVVAAFWFLSTLVPLLGMPESFVTPTTILLIAALLTVFLAAFYAASAFGTRRSVSGTNTVHSLHQSALRAAVVVSTFAGVMATAFAAAAQGLSLSSLLTLDNLVVMSTTSSIARYTGVSTTGAEVPALQAISYAGSVLAPKLLFSNKVAWRVASLGPPLALTAYSMATTARAPMLLAFFLYAGGLIAFRMAGRIEVPGISTRLGIAATVGAIFIFTAFMTGAFLRVGAESGMGDVVFGKAQTYAFGYLPALSVWIEAWLASPSVSLTFGTASLAGVSFFTGIPVEITRGYDEFLQITPMGHTSNVATALRPLIMDFGVAGTFLVIAITGFIIGSLQRSLLQVGRPTTAVLIGVFVGLTLMSQTNVMLTYTNVVAGIGLAWLFARLFSTKAEKCS